MQPGPKGFNALATRMIDVLAFIIPVAKFIEHEVEKGSHDKAKM